MPVKRGAESKAIMVIFDDGSCVKAALQYHTKGSHAKVMVQNVLGAVLAFMLVDAIGRKRWSEEI